MAHFALIELGELNFSGMAKDRLGQIQFKLVAQISTAVDLRAAAAAGTAENVTEDFTKDIAKGFGAAEARAAAALAAGLDTGMPMLIVDCALLGIGEDLVGLLGLLELLLGIFIARVAVRMVTHGKAPVRLANVGLASIARQIQHFVVILLRHQRPSGRPLVPVKNGAGKMPAPHHH